MLLARLMRPSFHSLLTFLLATNHVCAVGGKSGLQGDSLSLFRVLDSNPFLLSAILL